VASLDRARALGLLGDLLDSDGRYPEAFAAYSGCNESLRHLHRARARPGGFSVYARELLAAVRRAGLARFAAGSAQKEGRPGEPSGHVFLVGFPRSGTTLLEVVLDGHPQVTSLDEQELMTAAVRRFLPDPPDLTDLAGASDAELETVRADYWRIVRACGVEPAGKVFVDKYPMSLLKLPLIARLFPDARIVCLTRDPREVVFACFRRRFRMNPAMYEFLTLAGAAALYEAVMEFTLELRPLFGTRWVDLGYEQLMADFPGQMCSLCTFIGIEWQPAMADFGARVRTRQRATPSTAQLARGLQPAGSGHWRHYARELQPVLPALTRWAQRFGYPG
jgi:hypothetical protein